MIIKQPTLVENGQIVRPEIWEYHNCPNCNADITQEEIDVLHCNDCDKDIPSSVKIFQVWGDIVDESTITPIPALTESEILEFERLRVQSENIRMGLPES